MSAMKIEVVPDTSQPTGGHAIIRLRGIALLPPGATFRIDPIDETLNDGSFDGWPHGDLRPLDTRQTPDGIEMRIGPDVVDARLLEPGTPVTISVPDGHVSAELVWPDIPVSSRRPTAPVVMSPSQMAAELAAHERAKTEAADAADAARSAQLAAAARTEADRKLVPPAAADVQTQQQRMAAAARQLEAALALEPIEPDSGQAGTGHGGNGLDLHVNGKSVSGSRAALAKSTDTTERQRPSESRSNGSLSSLSKPSADRVDQLDVASDRDMSLPAIILKRTSDTQSGSHSSHIEPTQLRRETIEGRVEPASSPSRLLPFLAGAGAAGIAAAAVFAIIALRPGSGVGYPVVTGPEGAAVHKAVLADAFTVSAQSPRGELASDIDLPTALRLADYNLHGVDRPIDRAEAEFWLKKAMSLTASHSQIRWAMTQLGTLSAEPVTGTPDYEKARLLWEIAAANGDPVAMCFLGTLLEHGLGLAANKAKALDYFTASKAAGGCPNSDEAIARLSK